VWDKGPGWAPSSLLCPPQWVADPPAAPRGAAWPSALGFLRGSTAALNKKDIVGFGEPCALFQKALLEFPAPAIQLMRKRAAVLVAPFPLGLAPFD